MGADFLSAIPRNVQDPRYHKRASSGSTVQSNGPDSPLSQASTYNPRIATSDGNYSPSRYDFSYSPQTAKSAQSMPDNMMYSGNPAYGSIDMRRIHSSGHDDRASYGPQSVSSMSHHNSPATPQTWDDGYGDDKHFTGNFQSAAFQQSLQDVFPEQQQQVQYNMNSHRHTLQEQFSKSQQQHLRTGSPTSNPRDRSPFKPTSTFMGQQPVQRPQQQLPRLQKERTSISPKELMLDEHDIEDNQPSLFPDQSYQRQPSQPANFYNLPSFHQEPSVQIPQHYPFVSQSSQNIPDSTPEFPAHMLSMESTNEEGPSEPSSQQSIHRSQPRREPISRPVDVTSDGGTYSCTYHGCPQRFDTPAKLQKHKREGHRQQDPASSESPGPASKNSQAGPHKCDRINPSTGKPCNSIFSRPYDLTRHEDTIHNGRKMKVRCHLCTEEKTFSRNDALTRHMRVVHPDVDWVGKQKKRSQK